MSARYESNQQTEIEIWTLDQKTVFKGYYTISQGMIVGVGSREIVAYVVCSDHIPDLSEKI